MHYKTKEAAIAKYTPLLQDGADKEQLTAAMSGDEKKFSAEDIDELVNAIIDSAKAPSAAVDQKMGWYDEFHVRIQKREVRNVLANKNETIITGWELVKKLHPKLIEPHLAKSLNAFADGYQVDSLGLYLVAKGSMNMGDVIDYTTWAQQMGKNPKEDINILLNPKD